MNDFENNNPADGIIRSMLEDLNTKRRIADEQANEAGNVLRLESTVSGKQTLPAVSATTAVSTSVAAQGTDAQGRQIEQLQNILAPEVLNPQMTLQAGKVKEASAPITTSIARATRQAADSNQEEYATVARSAAKDRLQDLAFLSAPTMHADVYGVANAHLQSALAYAKSKGALAANEAQAKHLTDSLNLLGKKEQGLYTVDTFKEQSGHIYTETLLGEDGKLHLTTKNADGSTHSRESVSLQTMIGQTRADDLLGEIGQFHTQNALLERDLQVLTGESFTAGAGASVTASWEHLVSGNYAVLDKELHLTERYNAALNNRLAQLKDEKIVGKTHAGIKQANIGMDKFRGTKRDVKLLRKLKDDAGNPVFSEAELAAVEECVKANGYFTDTHGGNDMLNRAAMTSRRRIARNALEGYQAAGLGVVTSAYRAGKAAGDVTQAAGDILHVKQADHAERQVQKLVNRLGDEKSSGSQIERAKARLEEKQKKLGISSNKELLGKMKERSERARDIREKRIQIRRMTRGMDKTQARIALNELRQQERLTKRGSYSKRLGAKGARLQAKLARQQKIAAIRDKVLARLPGKALLSSGPVQVIGRMRTLTGRTRAWVTKKLLTVVAPIAGASLLIVVVLAGAAAAFLTIFSLFSEDNGNTDASGKAMNDLELVNRGMSEYENAQLAALEQRVTAIVKREYPRRWEVDGHPDAWFSGTIKRTKNKISYNGKGYRIQGYYRKNADGTPGEETSGGYVAVTGGYALIDVNGKDVYVDMIPESVAGGSRDGTVDVTTDYVVKDEYGKDASICNCMQLVSLYRYYYLFMDEEDEAEDSSFWLNDFKSGRMTDAWDRTHHVTTMGVHGKTHTKEWKDDPAYTDLEVKGELFGDAIGAGTIYHGDLSVCDNAGTYTYWVYPPAPAEPYQVTVSCCFGHVKATADVQVDSELETIAQGNRLRTGNGANIHEITWQQFEEEGTVETLTDLLGTYAEYYQQGYETYADFEVYFGNAANMMSSADIAKVLQMITDAYGELSPAQEAVITTGLSGCGKFSYSMAAHTNCGKGVAGGATDCSGYMSWIHNNCGLYSNTSLCNTTTTWSLAAGHKANDVSSLKPGDLIVKGEPGAASASEGNSNHVVMFIGILTDPDTGQTSPWIIECGGSAGGSGVHGNANKVYSYKTAVPLGNSDTW